MICFGCIIWFDLVIICCEKKNSRKKNFQTNVIGHLLMHQYKRCYKINCIKMKKNYLRNDVDDSLIQIFLVNLKKNHSKIKLNIFEHEKYQ